jgi:vancomycin resistance protein VanJ
MNWLGADRWWFGALNLYLPQSIWALPGLLLTGAVATMHRRLLWLPLLCVTWVLGPLMGLHWSWQPALNPEQTSFRIMTCNVKYGSRDIPILFDEIHRNHPDIVLFQDATRLLDSPDGSFFREWDIRYYGQFVIASRIPLEDAEVEWLNPPGQTDGCLRCRFMIAGTHITLYNVHLLSPREALSLVPAALKNHSLRSYTAAQLTESARIRYRQAQTLATLVIREPGAVIVAGDLNSPDASRVCTTLREAGLHDAFAQGGSGYGYTYGHFLIPEIRLPLPAFSFIRIDHIMMSSHLRTVRCWTGTAAASDHRPVYADLVVKGSSRIKRQISSSSGIHISD